MADKDLRNSLLRLDAMELSGVPESRRAAGKIVERDQRRVRRLTGLTVILWMLVTAAMAFVLAIYALYLPKEIQLLQNMGARNDTINIQGANEAQASLILLSVVSKGTVIVAGSVGLLALAMLFTVLLVLSARRATLRQVNASLLEISEQLKALRQPGGTQQSVAKPTDC